MPSTIKFDPRDLIMGPYVLCSKCGVEQFGILSVRGTYYTRRCRNCWHKGDFPLPDIRKRIIYIDQFAFSNIMKVLTPDAKGHERTASNPFWKELFETLGVVCHLQLAVCPDSKQHQYESLTSAFYKTLKRTYEHFSGGLSFYASDDIKRQQIARLTECWLKKEPATFDFDVQEITHGKLHEWADRIYITTVLAINCSWPAGAVETKRSLKWKMVATFPRKYWLTEHASDATMRIVVVDYGV